MNYSFSDNEQAIATLNYINTTNENIFLTGKAGSGKTTLLKQIVKKTFKNFVITAPTGVAAINAGGVTIHSFFQLPFGIFCPDDSADLSEFLNLEITTPSSLNSNTKINKDKLRIFRELELLIIDEVSMLRADLLDAIDTVLRKTRRKWELPFGGVQVLFIGDIFQLPPVSNAEQGQFLMHYYKDNFFFNAHVLQQSPPIYIELKKIYRQSDENFIQTLNNIRLGDVSNRDINLLNTKYQPDFDLLKNKSYIFLTTHNKTAQDKNRDALDKLKSRKYSFKAEVKGDFKPNLYPIDEKLELKVGAQVIFIKNDPEKQYYNGKIGEVVKLDKDKIVVETDNGEIELKKYTWDNRIFKLNEQTKEIEEEVIGTFTHYPLKLAWAITIHKSQGLTLEKAVIDANRLFAAGQIYVALSRLVSVDGLVLNSKISRFIPQHGIELHNFSKTEKKIEELENEIEAAQIKFLIQKLQNSYDFSKIESLARNHKFIIVSLKDKEEAKTYSNWYSDIVPQLNEDCQVASKTINHLGKFLLEKNYSHCCERAKNAEKFFINNFSKIGKKLHKKAIEISEEETHLELYESLVELLQTLYEKAISVIQFKILINSYSKKEDYDKKKIHRIEIEEFEEFFKSLGVNNKTEDKDLEDKKFQKQQTPKKKKSKTNEQSFNLFLQGKSVKEIADQRDLTEGTIYKHLADFVAIGEIDVKELIDEQKIEEIKKACKGMDLKKLSPIKNRLGNEYSYDEIKLVLNSMKEQHREDKNDLF